MADHTDAKWPPADGPTTVNVPRQQATLITCASIRINAPAELVWQVLLDVPNYGAWNNFCPKVTVHSQPDGTDANEKGLRKGTSFTFHVVMDSNKPTKETPTQLKVNDVSTPQNPSEYISAEALKDPGYTADLSKVYRISWSCEGGFVSRGLKTERFHEIIVLGENECEVRTWENQGGMLASTVRWFYKKTLDEKFKLWCDDLKKYSEQKASETSKN